MIQYRQMGHSRAIARAVAYNAGIPPEVFDKLLDEFEGYEYKRRKDYGAIVAEYADPEATKTFKEMDKEENE